MRTIGQEMNVLTGKKKDSEGRRKVVMQGESSSTSVAANGRVWPTAAWRNKVSDGAH